MGFTSGLGRRRVLYGDLEPSERESDCMKLSTLQLLLSDCVVLLLLSHRTSCAHARALHPPPARPAVCRTLPYVPTSVAKSATSWMGVYSSVFVISRVLSSEDRRS